MALRKVEGIPADDNAWFDEAIVKTYLTYCYLIVASTLAGLVYISARALRPRWAKKLRWLLPPAVGTLAAAWIRCPVLQPDHREPDHRDNPWATSLLAASRASPDYRPASR